jgi:hypothetical protein
MRTPPVLSEVDGEPVSPAIAPLLVGVHAEVCREPSDLAELHARLERLLAYLESPEGRTNANCWAADLFFMQNDRWERGWEHLPEGYQDLLADLGGALHDTVSHPEITSNFDSTPEQLLARLSRLSA